MYNIHTHTHLYVYWFIRQTHAHNLIYIPTHICKKYVYTVFHFLSACINFRLVFNIVRSYMYIHTDITSS